MNKPSEYAALRLFPEDDPEQTVHHIYFRLAPLGIQTIVESDISSDGEPKASVKIGHIRGAQKEHELQDVLSALLKILRGYFNLPIQIDSEGNIQFYSQQDLVDDALSMIP